MTVELVTKTVGLNAYADLGAEDIVEKIARHGRDSERKPGALIDYLTRKRHWSPLQHVYFGFKVTTSRAISAQIFRHQSMDRTALQEWSQRYDEVPGIEPIELRMEHPTNRQSSTEVFDPTLEFSDYFCGYVPTNLLASEAIEAYIEEGRMLYDKLLQAGVARECARMILPMASTTVIHLTGNIRSWLAFCNVRNDGHAQKEARDIALAITDLLEQELPGCFERLDVRKGNFM